MDERLERWFCADGVHQAIPGLCIMAVQLAQEGVQVDSPDPVTQEFITVHLGSILELGFSSTATRMLLLDRYISLRWMSGPTSPDKLLRRGVQIGDQCLWMSSQEFTASPHEPHWRAEDLLSLGRLGYIQAAANVHGWSRFDSRRFEHLGEFFEQYGLLLSTAATILGFHPATNSLLIHPQAVITIEDFLESLAIFQRQPSKASWQRLTTCVEARRWADPEFTFELPPQPLIE